MKYIINTAALVLLFTLQISLQSQSFSSPSTEAVVPWAASFYTGKGTANVQFCDSLNGVAFWREYAEYSITTDGGESWRDGRLTPQLDNIMEMFPIGRDTLVAIRDSQYVFHSYNAGETWTLVASLWGGERFAYGLLYNHKFGILFTKEGGMLRSTDLGASWNDAFWPYSRANENPVYDKGYLFVIEKSPSTPGILYSRDNGITWVRVELPPALSGYRKVGKSENGFFVVSNSNIFHLLSMTGEILQAYRPGGTDIRGGYGYVSDREIYALDNVGSGNRKLHRFSLPDTTLQTVIIGNNSMFLSNIIPTTHDKLVIYTKNWGRTHGIMTFHKSGHTNLNVEQFELPDESEATTLFFVNGTKGFAGRADGTIIMTTDGGSSWLTATTPAISKVVKKFIQRSESEFVAICADGMILESPDGGMTWNQIASKFHKTIVSASFAGRDSIFVCSSDSLYLTDPTWQYFTPVNTGISGGYFSDVSFYDRVNGSAIFKYGYFESKSLVTSDGGKTWTTTVYDRQMFSLDPTTLGLYYYIASEFSVWYDGSQGGSVNQEGIVAHTAQRPGGLIGMIYQNGQLFYNFGEHANFRRVFLGGGMSKFQVAPGDANTVYALAGGNRFFRLSRGTGSLVPSTILRYLPKDGSQFEFQNLKFSWEEPWSVSPVSEYHLQLARGDTSNIVNNFTDIDSTSVRINLNADTTLFFWRIRARNSNGWGAFNKWYSFRSSLISDEAKVWQTSLNTNLMSAILLPSGIAVAGDSSGKITRTTSPPDNWTTIDAQTTYPFLRFWRNPYGSEIISYSLQNTYFISINTGETWYPNASPFTGSYAFQALTSAAPNVYYGAGSDGTIFRGKLVSPLLHKFTLIWFSPYTGTNLDIATLGDSIIVAVGESGSVTISTNKGVSFSHQALTGNETLKMVSIAPDGTIVILNKKGERRVSSDMGVSWTYESFQTRAPIREIYTLDGASVIVDYKGGIYTSLSPTGRWMYNRLPDGYYANGINISGDKILLPSQNGRVFYIPLINGIPNGVKDEGVATQYELAQNYLNPFNSSTTIEFATPKEGAVQLTIYDITGRVVRSEVIKATQGRNRFHFAANDLHSGVYLYVLDFGTKKAYSKMILLK
ncbi:hypothetical protein MASR1M107_01530 [Ignavibacteriales bacterium]